MPIIGCTKENNCKKLAFLKAKMREQYLAGLPVGLDVDKSIDSTRNEFIQHRELWFSKKLNLKIYAYLQLIKTRYIDSWINSLALYSFIRKMYEIIRTLSYY